MDPAALGTARIGIDRIRRDQDDYALGDARIARQRPRRQPLRHLVAAGLRRTATLLEPATPTATRAPR